MLQNWSESAGNKVLLLFFAFTPNQWSEKSQQNSIFFLQEKSQIRVCWYRGLEG